MVLYIGIDVESMAACVEWVVIVFKAHRLVYHSTLDLRVIKKKKRR
jgi:hypothetical protein